MNVNQLRSWWWKVRLERIQEGMKSFQVEQALGSPTRKVRTAGIDIWAYDSKPVDDTVFVLRVGFTEDQICQAACLETHTRPATAARATL